MNKPTTILSDEHVNILKVIDILSKEVGLLETRKNLDKQFFEKAIRFIKEYADRFHHAKEEDILFFELSKDGVLQHCNPVKQMLYEHDIGRSFVKDAEDAFARNDIGDLCKNARGYCELLQEHIFKEDNILYPMADEALGEGIQSSMLERFGQVTEIKFDEKEWEF
ncbi:cation-binding protein [Candidatus Parcubacteria bacterium]|nr:MAG: cation-binding protein [Candidatus Parcubacteria bacterium]